VAAEAQARTIAQPTITPWVEDAGGTAFLCIPEGLGYPITREPFQSAMRG